MSLSPQKKVGIIIIALLLLGAVALVQTGKIQIPGLKSDALGSGGTPTIDNISPNVFIMSGAKNFTILGSGFTPVNSIEIVHPDGNISSFATGLFPGEQQSDGVSIQANFGAGILLPGVYKMRVRNSRGEWSKEVSFNVYYSEEDIVSGEVTTCLQLPPVDTNFCKDGKVVDGGKDNNNCPLTPKCLPKASLTANDVSELNLPLGTQLSYKWTSSSNAVSATSTYTTNKTTCSDKGLLSGTWLANTLNGSIASHILPSKYLGCSYTITFTVKDASGNTDSSVLKLNIVDPPAPTATLKVNGSIGSVTARVGDRVRYEWSSDNAATATSTYTTNKASCGAGGNWLINKPNGALVSGPLPASYAGCVFTLNFTANQAVTGKKVTSTVVMTVQ